MWTLFKNSFFIVHFLLVVIINHCTSQSNLVFKAGLSISKFDKTSISNSAPWNASVQPLYGPVFGATYERHLSKLISLDGGLYINTKGGKSETFFLDNDFWIAYLQTPIGLSIHPKTSSSKWSYYFSSAFVPSFDIGTSTGMPKDNNLSLPRHRYHDIDIWLGASVFRGRWGLNFQYCHGLKTVAEFENYYSLKNRSVNIMLAYRLGKKD